MEFEIKNKIPLTLVPPIMKYLGIHLTKYGLYKIQQQDACKCADYTYSYTADHLGISH